MPTRKPRKRPTAVSTAQRARAAMSREARAAYGEIQQGVRHLEKSITEIRQGLRRAEHKIEADARGRIRELRKEARAQLGILESKQREAVRALKKVSAAAGESWREIKQSADSLLGDARATATTFVERVRNAFKG